MFGIHGRRDGKGPGLNKDPAQSAPIRGRFGSELDRFTEGMVGMAMGRV